MTGYVTAKDWASLRPYEELKQEVDAGHVLTGFHSAPLNFEPTFKVARTKGYEYNQKRTPSYCDRILWKSLPPFAANIQCNDFHPCENFATSDHKPVRALHASLLPRQGPPSLPTDCHTTSWVLNND